MTASTPKREELVAQALELAERWYGRGGIETGSAMAALLSKLAESLMQERAAQPVVLLGYLWFDAKSGEFETYQTRPPKTPIYRGQAVYAPPEAAPVARAELLPPSVDALMGLVDALVKAAIWHDYAKQWASFDRVPIAAEAEAGARTELRAYALRAIQETK